MCKQNRISSFIFTSLIAFISSNTALAQIIEEREDASVAEIVQTKGDETLNPIETGVWQKAMETQDLVSGDTLQTGAFGGLALAFLDRTQVRLHANSRMQVSVDDNTKKSNIFDLQIGKIWSRSSKPDQPITVKSPSATAAIRGTDWYLDVAENGDTRLIVLDGEVEFFNEFGNVSVPAGQSAFARKGQAPVIELLVTSDDRPIWALTPRSDWLRLIDLEEISKNTTDANLADILELLNQGGVRKAEKLLAAIPSSAETNILNAFIALSKRDPERSSEFLKAPESQSSESFARLASILNIGSAIERTELSKGAQLIAQDKKKWGEDTPHLILSAYLEAYAGRYESAANIASQARLSSPNDVNAVLINAQIAALSGDDDLFTDAMDTAIDMAPHRDNVWHWYGIYLTIAGGVDAEAAKQAYQNAIALNPEAVTSISTLGTYESILGRYQQALNLFDQALILDPTEPYALAGKAYVYINMDRLDLAQEILGQLIEVAPTHPETQTVLAGYSILKRQTEEAALASGRVIAANPNRPGAAQLDAQAHWHAGRHDVGQKIIANTTRLDNNNPVSALVASIMAQDQYNAGQAVSYAKASWDAYDRNLTSGLVNLPSSQSGRLSIGAPFQNLGLVEQGEYYTSLSASQYNSDSAFAFSSIYPDSSATQSSLSQGLMLSPLSISYPTKFAQFFLEERHEQTLGSNVTIGENGTIGASVNAEVQGIYRPGKHPVAYYLNTSFNTLDGELENDRTDDGQASLLLSTQMNGKHGLLFRSSISRNERQLAGTNIIPDTDNSEDQTSLLLDLGYTLTNAWNDRWMLRTVGRRTKSAFNNPSALGTTVTDLDFSLLSYLGVEAAQAAATRGIFDTTLSTPDEPLLVYVPFGTVPVTEQVGLSILPLRDDLDPVIQGRANTDTWNIQTKRMFAAGDFNFSMGLETSFFELENAITENFVNSFGLGSLVDVFDFTNFQLFPLASLNRTDYLQKSRTESFSGHLQVRWEPAKWIVLEAGVFPNYSNASLDIPIFDIHVDEETSNLDPRLGVSLRHERGQLRFAAQRSRLPNGIDTLAPIGSIGLTPNRNLGFLSGAIDSAIIQIDHEITPLLFLNIEGEYQELDQLSASLERRRLGESLYTLEEAKLNRSKIELNWQLMENAGLALGYVNTSSEITGDTQAAGFDIPLVPEHIAFIKANFVDARFFRMSAGLEYSGKRYGDILNTVELDETLLANISVVKESRDKSWLFSANLNSHLSDSNFSSPNIENTNNIVSLNFTKRW